MTGSAGFSPLQLLHSHVRADASDRSDGGLFCPGVCRVALDQLDLIHGKEKGPGG